MEQDTFEILKYGYQHPKKVKELINGWLKVNYHNTINDWKKVDDQIYKIYIQHLLVEIYYNEKSGTTIRIESKNAVNSYPVADLSNSEIIEKFQERFDDLKLLRQV